MSEPLLLKRKTVCQDDKATKKPDIKTEDRLLFVQWIQENETLGRFCESFLIPLYLLKNKVIPNTTTVQEYTDMEILTPKILQHIPYYTCESELSKPEYKRAIDALKLRIRELMDGGKNGDLDDDPYDIKVENWSTSYIGHVHAWIFIYGK